MFLKSLMLKNVKCFNEVWIDFDLPGGDNRKWTVLTGENGTGKSTILKSIGLVLAGSDALPELIGDVDSWISRDAQSAEIIAEIETAKGEQREIKLIINRGEKLSKLISRSEKSLGPLNDALEHTSRNYLTIGFGSSRRMGDASLSNKTKHGSSHSRAQSMKSLFDSSMTLNPLESWAMQIDYISDGAGLETIRSVLSDFLPEMQFSHIDKHNETLIFKTEDGEVPLRSLSDGYQSVAAWVGDLLYQITNIFEYYKDPLSARGLLIIDEIDLHLHPKWQRRLVDFLESRLPRMQLVVTTHSVVIAQQAPLGALHYCVRRNGEPAVERFNINPGDLLLNQLIATEAFGQMSDESLQVETTKSEYRELHRKTGKSGQDRERMAAISAELGGRPEDEGSGVTLNRKQRELMEKILSTQSE